MDINEKTINTIRVLSAEGIQRANSGHPGICLGSAPIIYTVYNDFLKFNPQNPAFSDRDRFVLSAGHGSMLLYTTLHLFGYDVSMEDLKNFRQYGSKTPGHPEYGETPGVEITTGPLGQGIANAVGMAIAETHLAAHFNREGYEIVDHYTYALAGDGCNMEGIAYEAASLAGTLGLGKLIVLYDKNNITIEGNTDIAFKEDVGERYRSMGWQVLYVDDANDLEDLRAKIALAKAEKSKPSFIVCHTTIGFGSPNQGTASVHGSPLGEKNIAALRENLGYTEPPFTVAEDVAKHTEEIIERGKRVEDSWNALFEEYAGKYPGLAKDFRLWQEGKFDPRKELAKVNFDKPDATRNTGYKCLNAVSEAIPSLFGGSADLAPSNKTNMTARSSYSSENYDGSNVHFGIREHAMAAICNGLAAHRGIKPYCSTFFMFSDYMKNAIRLSALMKLPVVYIFTHDSIGVGEDGPTHEPIEQLVGLRSIPDFSVYRPADGEETKAAYEYAFTRNGPTAIILSRQNLPQLGYEGSDRDKGGYVLLGEEDPDVILIASGSEVSLAVEARKILKEKGVKTRVVSMPCMEVFEAQSEEYKNSVLPKGVKRVAIEAASAYSWYKYVGADGATVTIDRFGASGAYEKLYDAFGITPEKIATTALTSLA